MSLPDLATGVASRIVTIDQVEFTEDAPTFGTVTFTLPCDLRHAVSGKGISAGSRTVTLIDGQASLRIFTDQPGLTSDKISRRYGDTWSISVKKSWLPYAYPIRVPAGTGPISLAAIPIYDWRAQ